MNLSIVALRETMVPPSTYGFSQPTSHCQSKDLFGAPVAAWRIRVEEGSIYVGWHLPLVYNEIYWWSPDEEAVS